ncbi:shewanella-like protein phosphatase 1 [Senna tora]|uniref:Shewanella-like protein phosphatase 1 n=1 Tax=Senna tora TaxID=362788 RepID=A0A834T8P0_9FABA|nr:shewanella-like protein phosphatase 1 [Senna tora]
MASICLNSISFPPPSHPRKLTETPSSSLLLDANNHITSGALKPIVVNGNPPTFVSAPGRRIVAVGDLHGDLRQTRSALEMAGVLSSDDQNLWTGGETVLIQLGDILDRGEDEIAILSLLRSLDIQAREKGGAVFQVNGNHETMNVEGDFRYVESGGFDESNDFLEYINESEDNWEETLAGWIDVSERWKDDGRMSNSYWGPWNLVKRQKGIISRSILFRPGGSLACELARHPVVLKVNDWVFCHGGLLPHHVAYGIERMNKEVSDWMKGLSENDDGTKMPFIATRGYDSVVWNRLYSRDTSELVDYNKAKQASTLMRYIWRVDVFAELVGQTQRTSSWICTYHFSVFNLNLFLKKISFSFF